ncbi:MAG TPA: hypothetical protein DCK76_02790 [Desulfotomaculum sp.]|nr:hypothetical protein [Desulfotomaculum sp.]HBY05312.1 hypothetical protein [Desulfotomaculum sp.]
MTVGFKRRRLLCSPGLCIGLSSNKPEHRLYEQGPEVPAGSPGAKRRAKSRVKGNEGTGQSPG